MPTNDRCNGVNQPVSVGPIPCVAGSEEVQAPDRLDTLKTAHLGNRSAKLGFLLGEKARRWLTRFTVRGKSPLSATGPPDRNQIQHRLRSFSAGFTACHQRTEAEFVELGRILRSLHCNGVKLSQVVSKHLGEMQSSLTASQISGADGMAACSLRELHAGMEVTSQQLGALRTVVVELRRLQSRIQAIDRVGIFIRSSVFGFAIESARTSDCRCTFASFVSELRSLADRIAEVTESSTIHVRSTQTAQDRELRDMSASLAKLRELAKSVEVTAAATAADAQGLLDASLLAAQQTSERTRSIAQLADDAVYHLQLGDIIRQKAEHIAATLEQTAQQLSAALSDEEFGIQAALAERVLAIQAGHLELIGREIESASSKLSGSFRNLVDESKQLTAAMDRQTSHPNQAQESAGPLEGFKADLRHLEQLHAQCGALCLNARNSANRAGDASATLATHVEELKAINQDIHLQALNAIVKTADLGPQGATLAVLSAHVEWLYRESTQGLGEIVATLDAILRAAGRDSAGQREDGGGNADWIGNLRAGMQRIESASAGSQQVRTTAKALAEEQQATLASSSGRLGFLAELSADTVRQVDELASLGAALKPWLTEANTASTEALAAIAQRYTMQSERDVHGITSAVGAVNPQPVPLADDAGVFEDFSQPMEVITAQEVANVSARPVDDKGAGLATATPSKAVDPTLGDNVELF